MASPLSLLLFGVIAGVLADYEDQDTTRLYFSNDGTALPGTTEGLLSRSSNGMDDEIIEIFKNSKKDIIGSDDPTSILEKALYSISQRNVAKFPLIF
nr:unnamed protein product [Haemonchus contortus]